MSETVSFPVNGQEASGHLALPSAPSGPGVIVIQEWWGLNAQTRGVADRLAEAGFVALAPDLYHGELAGHDEMDKAGRLMQELPPERAVRDTSGAIDFLLAHEAVSGDGVGVIGFCMGGMLSWRIGAARGDAIGVVVPFYGFPTDDEPDWSGLTAPVRAHLAAVDDFFPPERGRALEQRLREAGKDVEVTVHDAGHAFMNETNAIGTYDAALAERLWPEVIATLERHLA